MRYRLLLLIIICQFVNLSIVNSASAQEERVQNRPYTDLRPLHFGIVVGSNLQETELRNVGLTTLRTGEQ